MSGAGAEGLRDQYADGRAAKVWDLYVGRKQSRMAAYKNWILNLLKEKRAETVLDAACGTGIDSVMLVEAGYQVTSTDGSDQMLKFALKERWQRRKEEAFDKWIIEEANWLTLIDDLEDKVPEEFPRSGYDVVMCLGNSFSHLPDVRGDNSDQIRALENLRDAIRPGGTLLIDHRNYDVVLDTGSIPAKSIYYNSDQIKNIKCTTHYVDGKPSWLNLDYTLDLSSIINGNNISKRLKDLNITNSTHEFRLSYYPYRLKYFTQMIKRVFGDEAEHKIFGDFRPLGEVKEPAYYIHVLTKMQ